MIAALALLLATAAQAVAPAPPASADAPAADRWIHPASGITAPRRLGTLEIAQQREASPGGVDTIVQYGTDSDPVSLYIYRASFPDPALWMERGWQALAQRFPGTETAAPARPLVIDGVPVGFARAADVAGGGPFRATGLAIVRNGDWFVKMRVSSARGNAAAVRATIERVVGAIRLPAATPAAGAPLPRCPAAASDARGAIVTKDIPGLVDRARPIAPAIATLMRAAPGEGDLQVPWCVDGQGLPPVFGTMLRTTGGDGRWAALLGDAHMSLAALPHPPQDGQPRWGLWAANANAVRLVAIYDAPPGFETAMQAAVPVLTNRSTALLEAEPPVQP